MNAQGEAFHLLSTYLTVIHETDSRPFNLYNDGVNNYPEARGALGGGGRAPDEGNVTV